MANRDIVVIGGSAGSLQALMMVVRGLPDDLPAALFVVVHISPIAESRLPEILSRVGVLPASHARHGEPIERGRIYVAPPDRHMLIREGWIELSRGPRENHARPAIDPMFRTAARAYGPRTIGVVLSGALYDGSLGLMAVAARGGVTVVQDPREAAFASMPQAALESVAADHVLPVGSMAATLTELIGETATAKGEGGVIDDDERLQAVIAEDFGEQANNERSEETTIFTCPDCGGVLWQNGKGADLRFRCHVGHAYAPELLLDHKSDELEAALWKSLRLLKEKATMTQQLATRTRAAGAPTERIEEQGRLDQQYVAAIQDLLQAMPGPMDRAVVAGRQRDGDGA